MERELNELVDRLKKAVGNNLKAVVLYGSAASGEFHPKHSDLNVLCILERLDAIELEKLNPASVWWERKGHPAPLVFTFEALRDSAGLFAIELLDIKTHRRMLFGEDFFARLEVPMTLHRLQVKYELRTNLIRLRQGYLAAPPKPKRLLELMTGSISAFTALFRHALIALGEQPRPGKRAVVDGLASLLAIDSLPFHTVLDIREGKQRGSKIDAAATFRAYLGGVTRVVEEVNRRLEQGTKGS